MAKLLPYKGDYYLWNYIPSLPAAIIFCVLFAIFSIAHSYRLYRKRQWFCIPFVIGGVLETIGYGARIGSHFGTASLIPYIIQNLFLLLPPAFFSASIYMVLKRTIVAVKGESYSIIPVRWLTRLFVLGDVISFWTQGGGGGLMANASTSNTGEKVVVAGLLIQVVLFGLFCVTAVVFHYRFKHYSVSFPLSTKIPWEKLLWMLYGVSLLIMVRSVFRVIEFAMGSDGYLLENEWTLYVFDAVLMFAVMVVFYIRYPGDLYSAQAQRLSMDVMDANPSNGLMEMESPAGHKSRHSHDPDRPRSHRHHSRGASSARSHRHHSREPSRS